jgi:hypothetical protein
MGTARSLLPKSAVLRSPAWVLGAVTQCPRARLRAFLRPELQSDLIVVSHRAVQRSGGVSSSGIGGLESPSRIWVCLNGQLNSNSPCGE